MSNLDVIFKIPLSGGGLLLPLSFPQALSREFRVHWRGGRAWSAQTGLRWSPGPRNSFCTFTDVSLELFLPLSLLLFTKSYLTLSWPCGLSSGSSVHGISQARILEWIAISFSRVFSWAQDQTQDSCSGRRVLYHWANREALLVSLKNYINIINYFLKSTLCGSFSEIISTPHTKCYSKACRNNDHCLEDEIQGFRNAFFSGLRCSLLHMHSNWKSKLLCSAQNFRQVAFCWFAQSNCMYLGYELKVLQ